MLNGWTPAMLLGWLRNERGVTGLAAGSMVWVFSAVALGFAMRANLEADEQERMHDAGVLVRHLHGAALVWGLSFTVLQLLSFLMFAFVLRACYRLRTAVCFSAGAGLVMLGDVLGLAALLVWVGMTVGVE